MEIMSKKKQLSGSSLKVIAIITMLIDHIGAGILENLPGCLESQSSLHYTYYVFRYIGRIAFPIFCFLLVEGYLHTSNVKKYAIRLFIFAIISEIPFDLAFYHTVFITTHQNVFFTLLIGLITLVAIDHFNCSSLLRLVCMFAGFYVSYILNTDYAGFGVVFIVLLYMLHDNIKLRNFVCSLAIAWEITAPIAFIPITLYNGERGLKMKYFFYLFYPVHLLLIYAISRLL
ncbi:TraX protein [Lachnotalea glycerini]|uniref:TraX protein n=2 Tax=Lachnotalea glycerini TaxID=1763509 RepID=A0A318EVB7_9FIRM|nr:TraX protein [Lachnotalea glycerini]